MICLINPEKLRKFTKRSELKPIEINLLSHEGAEHAIYLVTRMFMERGGRYHLRFWTGGSPVSKGYLVGECLVNKNEITILGE